MASERVLLVDDDPAFLAVMGQLLREEGRVLVTAADGELGLAEARRQTPDLIILDVHMPRMDGFTLIRHLRAEPAFALVPVIFLTDLSEPDQRLMGFHLGADDYLSKEVLLEELAARVRGALRRRATIAEAIDLRGPAAGQATLRGSLDQIGLPSLLTLLEMERKTGTLELQREASGESAVLTLRDGRVMRARIDDRESPCNTEAVAALLGWQRGSFTFRAGSVEGPDEMQTSTTNLLMTAAYILDESSSCSVG